MIDYLKKTDFKTFYLIFLIYFVLNFLGLSIIKFYYIIVLFYILIFVLRNDFNKAIIPIIGLFFIEGQGRILWGYNPLIQNIFDFILLILIIKDIIKRKKILNINLLPRILVVMISLHFIWYIIQFTNINNLGFFPILAATKIYIFPFLLFFYFLQNPLSDEKKLQELSIFTLFMIIIQLALIFFQSYQGESFLVNMHPYYAQGKQAIFSGALFRPYGTSHYPGQIGPHLVFLSGMIFINRWTKIYSKVFLYIIILLSSISLFLMQSRAALIKYILLILLIQICIFIIDGHKLKKIFQFSFILIGAIILVQTSNISGALKDNPIYENALKRISTLLNPNEALKGRLGIFEGLNIIQKRLTDAPFGLGPGRTGAANTIAKNQINEDQFFGPDYSWAYDNLFVSLATDLGIGMFIYLFIIVSIPILIFGKITTEYKNYHTFNRTKLIALLTIIVMIIGNWGSITLPYNPESFSFWLWSMIGLSNNRPIL